MKICVESAEIIFESAEIIFESAETIFESAKTFFESTETIFESTETIFESAETIFELVETTFEPPLPPPLLLPPPPLPPPTPLTPSLTNFYDFFPVGDSRPYWYMTTSVASGWPGAEMWGSGVVKGALYPTVSLVCDWAGAVMQKPLTKCQKSMRGTNGLTDGWTDRRTNSYL